jgi:hypothetical protein
MRDMDLPALVIGMAGVVVFVAALWAESNLWATVGMVLVVGAAYLAGR